jgi:zinc/manganese transport system substrate-binding protein
MKTKTSSLSTANLFVTLGLIWRVGGLLITDQLKGKIQKGSDGYVDASVGVTLMQVPSSINRAEGDIHIYGNPHYWLDPANGKVIARNICNGLEKISPENKVFFEANLKTFNDQLDAKLKTWNTAMAAFKGQSHCLSQ